MGKILRKVNISERLWRVSIKLLRESFGNQIEKQEAEKKRHESKLHQVELKLKRLLEMRLDGALENAEYREKKIEMLAEKERLLALIVNTAQNNND